MGVARKVAMEGGGRAGSLGKVLLHGSQAVILFGAETWVLSAPMVHRLEEVYMGFLRQVTKSKEKRLRDRLWWKAASNKVIQGVETQPLQTYLNRRQVTVTEWVALRPIFDVCAR